MGKDEVFVVAASGLDTDSTFVIVVAALSSSRCGSKATILT